MGPPAPSLADAELRGPGLFYASNARGAYRGGLVFVWLARPFRREEKAITRVDRNAPLRRSTLSIAVVVVVAATALAAFGISRARDSTATSGEPAGDVPRPEASERRSPSGRYVVTGGRVQDLRSGRSWVTEPIDEPLWSRGERYLAFVRHRLSWGGSADLFVLDLERPASAPRQLLGAGELRVRWLAAARLGFWREDVELGPTDAVVARSASIGTVTPTGDVRTIHEAGGYSEVVWSPGGDYVAYTVVGGERGRARLGLRDAGG